MSQMDLFTETPVSVADRDGEVAVSVGVAATKPKPRRKRRPNPQVTGVALTVETGDRIWTIAFPAPGRMLSVNGNPHWRRTSPIRKAFREAMYLYARQARLPQGLQRVRLDFVLRFPSAGRRDAANYHGNVIKPCVDALGPAIDTVRAGKPIKAVGYGLIPDDTAQYLDGPHVVLGEPVRDKAMPYGQVAVTITDLSCTGVTAAWCPNHGDYTCPDAESPDDRWQRPLDDPRCPLHAPSSPHGEVAS